MTKGKNPHASPNRRGTFAAEVEDEGTPSPSKINKFNKTVSGAGSFMNSSMQKSKHGKNHHNNEDEEVELGTPTSIKMKNSFIIKNADSSFENYYTQMRRRKTVTAGNFMG